MTLFERIGSSMKMNRVTEVHDNIVIHNMIHGKYNSQKWISFLEKAQQNKNSIEYDNDRNKFLSLMRDYEQKNHEALTIYYNYYKEAISPDFYETHYVFLKEKKLRALLSQCKILVLTANPIEKAVFHFMMIRKSHRKIIRILNGNTVYFILKWGKYWVAHIHQSETGSYKNMGSNATINEALKHFTPNVIISLGVAFGIDYTTQNIGDVIVSRRILPYSQNKRDEDKIKPDRSQDKTIDDWLHVRLINASSFLEGVTYGDILSGGSVMSSFAEKDTVCLGYTKADFIVGGEMEGDALFQYAKNEGIPGVVIKGICDWGVAKNNIYPEDPEKEEVFKDSLQAFAMTKAIEKSSPLFNDKEIFAVPKDANVKEIQRKYRYCRNFLIVSQMLMLVYGILLLYSQITTSITETVNNVMRVFESPVIWICFPLILCIIFFGLKWREKWGFLKNDFESDKELIDRSSSSVE